MEKLHGATLIQQLSNLSLQKRAICLMTNFHEQSSPVFRKLNIIKLDDLISYHIAVFMYDSTIPYYLPLLMYFSLK